MTRFARSNGGEANDLRRIPVPHPDRVALNYESGGIRGNRVERLDSSGGRVHSRDSAAVEVVHPEVAVPARPRQPAGMTVERDSAWRPRPWIELCDALGVASTADVSQPERATAVGKTTEVARATADRPRRL